MASIGQIGNEPAGDDGDPQPTPRTVKSPPAGGYRFGGWNPANWGRWIYTGDPNAPDAYLDAALNGPGGGGESVLGNSGRAKVALDVISVADPTPISDGLGAFLSYAQGNDAEARRELALAAIPGAAGQLGKLRKIGKVTGKVDDAIDVAKSVGSVRKGTDFIEGTGRLGGDLYDKSKLAKMEKYMEKRGVEFKVGDEFVPWGKAGGFAQDGSKLVLLSNPTKYEVWHELAHYVQFKKIGRALYEGLERSPKLNAPEEFVFNFLKNSFKRWNALTPDQQASAIRYIQKYRGIK